VLTGFKGHGVKTRAVTGHAFGLNLSPEDKKALIAFLKDLIGTDSRTAMSNDEL